MAALTGPYHDTNGKYVQTERGKIPLPLNNFWLPTGAPLAAFADGASPTPGLALDNSEAAGIRWNNHGTPTEVVTTFQAPTDRKPGTVATVKVRASKSGATAADTSPFTINAFNQVDGALHDADADFGGDTNAMTGDAAAKTVQTVGRDLASADLVDGATVTLKVQPKDGELDTDDVTVHEIWIEYEKIATSTSAH